MLKKQHRDHVQPPVRPVSGERDRRVSDLRGVSCRQHPNRVTAQLKTKRSECFSQTTGIVHRTLCPAAPTRAGRVPVGSWPAHRSGTAIAHHAQTTVRVCSEPLLGPPSGQPSPSCKRGMAVADLLPRRVAPVLHLWDSLKRLRHPCPLGQKLSWRMFISNVIYAEWHCHDGWRASLFAEPKGW